MSPKARIIPPDICPVCGCEVPPAARACPECGADEETGWNEDHAIYDGLDLPDNEFSYDNYLKREFGSADEARGKARNVWMWVWIIAAVLLFFGLVIFWGN